VRGEAVPRPPSPAGAALAADRSPVQDDEVTRRQPGNVLTHRLDETCCLVAEQVGKVLADAALAIVQVGMADAARLDLDQRLARTRVGDDYRGELDRSALRAGNYACDLMCHLVRASHFSA
jgi:hypothetical protein